MAGNGSFQWKDGDRYDGAWRDGKFDGQGKYRRADGIVYEGRWSAGEWQGPDNR
jgi:hypothetical protein